MIELQFEITKLKSDLEVEHKNYIQQLDVRADLKKKLDVKDRDCKIKDESLGSLEHLAKEKTNKIKQLEQDIKNLQEQVLIEQNNVYELNQSLYKIQYKKRQKKLAEEQKQQREIERRDIQDRIKYFRSMGITHKLSTDDLREAPKTKDGAIEALCKAGNFYDFEKQANVKCLKTGFKVFRVDIKEDSFKAKLEQIHLINVPEDYEVYNEGSHLVCQKLMKKFVKEVNDAVNEAEAKGLQVKRYPQIVYSDFLILEEGPNSFWIAERFFNGEFIKYNNNFGYINNEETQLNQMAQVFSYYTYHVSNFSYMVNDVQGVSTYFTDPAINTCKGDFDDTDMGEDGQGIFMFNFEHKKYICSELLKLLNIYPD